MSLLPPARFWLNSSSGFFHFCLAYMLASKWLLLLALCIGGLNKALAGKASSSKRKASESDSEEWAHFALHLHSSNQLPGTEAKRNIEKATSAGAKGLKLRGKKGKKNAARTLKRAWPKTTWPSLYWAKIPIKDKKSNARILVDYPFQVPHEWLGQYMVDTRALERSQPAQGSKVHRALLKQTLRLSAEDPLGSWMSDLHMPLGFHGDGVPVQGTMRQESLDFLTINMPTNKHHKDFRKAWQMAFPNLGSSSVNAVLKKISGIKTYLLRKQRNAKTGERMPPWVKRLLGVLNSHLQKVDPPATEKSKAAMAVSIATAVGDSGTEELSEAQEDAQSLDCISVSSTAPCSQSTQIASLAGEGGLKRPAASSSSVEEKPASNGFKRPASASAGGLKKAIRKAPIAWQQSPSFGFVKFTVATEKSYIVSKQKLDDKPTCLVNVQGTGGVDHGQVVGQLMDLVLNEGGLTKAMVVAKKQELLKKWKSQWQKDLWRLACTRPCSPKVGRDFSKLLKAKMTIFDVIYIYIYIILCIYMFFET